jgi:hypothetical protein
MVDFSSLLEAETQMNLALAVAEDKKNKLQTELSILEAKYTCPTCGKVNDGS